MRKKHVYDLGAEQEAAIPAPEAKAAFLKKCTMEGGIVPQGFPVIRGDTRTWEEIRDSGGFIPAFELAGGETVPEHARRRAEMIMQASAKDFVHYWKYPKECREKRVGGWRGSPPGVMSRGARKAAMTMRSCFLNYMPWRFLMGE